MKNLLTIAIVLGFVLSFAGCGTENDPTIGIDEQDGVGYGEDAATSALRCEVVNMKLTEAPK